MSSGSVLLLDTNVASRPIYDFLVGEGYEVFVMGHNEVDYLARTNQNFIKANYSDFYVLSNVIAEHKFDFVVPGCNDLSYLMAARVAEQFGFPGLESSYVTGLINDKDKFRMLASSIAMTIPKVYLNPDEIESDSKVIVKPVDAYSGRGISIVENKRGIDTAIENAKRFSRTNAAIVEEFVTGQLYSHSAFLSGGKILFDFLVEEHGTANPFVVDTSYVLDVFPTDVLEKIRSQIEKFAGHLHLKDGLIHTQLIVNTGEFWLLEVTKRCPGDLYSLLIQYSTDFPYAEMYAQPFLNKTLPNLKPAMNTRRIIRHTISARESFKYRTLKFSKTIKIQEMIHLTLPGTVLKPSPFDRVALLFIECGDEQNFNEIWRTTLDRRLYSFS